MPEQIENRMVVDSEWVYTDPKKVEEVLNEKGYHNLRTNEFVSDADAFDNALWECMFGKDEDLKKEFKEAVLELYFNGDWVRED